MSFSTVEARTPSVCSSRHERASLPPAISYASTVRTTPPSSMVFVPGPVQVYNEADYPSYISEFDRVMPPGAPEFYADYPAYISNAQWDHDDSDPAARTGYADFYRALFTDPEKDYADDYLRLKNGPHIPRYTAADLAEKHRLMYGPREPPPQSSSYATFNPAPYAAGPTVAQNESQPGAVQQALNNKPPKTYTCDGQTVKDERGMLVAVLKHLDNDGGVDLTSPQGKPWLRYDKPKNTILNIDPKQLAEKNKEIIVVAVIHQKPGIIYHGDKALWDQNPKSPPRIYQYTEDSSAGDLHTTIIDASTNREVAFARRQGRGLHPVTLAVQQGVPYHLLLISLFAL